MKKIYVVLFSFLSISHVLAQGFASTAINFGAPYGGKISSAINFGFNGLGGNALPGEDTGSQSWSYVDMNGDAKPDLVVTGQKQGGQVTSFSPTSNQYWKVYLNNGSSFSSTEINWSLPVGGLLSGGTNFGFNKLSNVAAIADDAGSQSWNLIDLDGDKKPDLVVTSQKQGGNITSFSPTSNQYWKVYLNNGNGFASNPINWTLPNGGLIVSSFILGFVTLTEEAFPSDGTGSQSWNVMDINGDNTPELIVTAQLQGGYVSSFSPTSNQYWKVYSNTGSGFSSTPTNWPLPNGGLIYNNTSVGYDYTSGNTVNSYNTGSQSWSLSDFDGDKKIDLIIVAQLQGGQVTSFSPTSNQYWKVYLNNGSGFSSSPINWNLPLGGKIETVANYGFNTLSGYAFTPQQITGSQSWSVMDINADTFVDLVITAQIQGGNATSFSPTSNQYWQVYYGNGSNFSATPINWALPNGGKIQSGTTFGFDATGGTAIAGQNTGSQTWAVTDIDGDNLLDLVICAQMQGGQVTSFSPASNQYWQVYKNGSVGIEDNLFNSTSVNIYPNPVASIVNINTQNFTNEFKVEIFNTLGQIVLKEKITSAAQQINLQYLASGIYTAKLSQNEKIIKTQKLIKE